MFVLFCFFVFLVDFSFYLYFSENVMKICRKIPLIHPGRIYGQRANLMGLYSGRRGGLLFGRKSTSICNLLNLLLFLPYFGIFREICSKLTIKTQEYVTSAIKLKIKAPWRRSGLFIVNFEHVLLFLRFTFLTVFLLLTLIG